jgi:hypothetical protein
MMNASARKTGIIGMPAVAIFSPTALFRQAAPPSAARATGSRLAKATAPAYVAGNSAAFLRYGRCLMARLTARETFG